MNTTRMVAVLALIVGGFGFVFVIFLMGFSINQFGSEKCIQSETIGYTIESVEALSDPFRRNR